MSSNDTILQKRMEAKSQRCTFVICFFLKKKKTKLRNTFERLLSRAYPYQDRRALEPAYPSYHTARGGVHPGQVASLSQGSRLETDNHLDSHLGDIWIHQLTACVLAVGGSWCTRSNTGSIEDHKNHTYRDSVLE